MANYKIKPTLNGEGGGGTTYTAGNGIQITDENVINADIKVLEVSNITGLTTAQCEALNVGDVVVEVANDEYGHIQRKSYVVQKRDFIGMSLFTFDGMGNSVFYVYTDEQWFYQGTSDYFVGANPELEGDEEELSSIIIDGDKYKVSGGSGASGSQYLLSKFDFADIMLNKHIDVDHLIEVIESHDPNFSTLEYNNNKPCVILGFDKDKYTNLVYLSEDYDQLYLYNYFESSVLVEDAQDYVKTILLQNKDLFSNPITENDIQALKNITDMAKDNSTAILGYFSEDANNCDFAFSYDELKYIFVED